MGKHHRRRSRDRQLDSAIENNTVDAALLTLDASRRQVELHCSRTQRVLSTKTRHLPEFTLQNHRGDSLSNRIGILYVIKSRHMQEFHC
jgi:hypothetical protein